MRLQQLVGTIEEDCVFHAPDLGVSGELTNHPQFLDLEHKVH